MKRNDSGDFCLLYLELTDDRTTLFNVISGQKKPVVILLAEQSKVFQRPEDFSALKHIKRQLDMPIVFVIPSGEILTQMAVRNGFPVYHSMDSLADAITVGQVSRQRILTRTTVPLGAGAQNHSREPRIATVDRSPKKTVPLALWEDEIILKKTGPLVAPTPQPFVAPPRKQQQRSRLSGLLVFLTALAFVLAGIGSFLVLFARFPGTGPVATATGPVVVGHIAFLSSEQLSENSSQGIADQLLVDLNGLSSPAPGKNYYAWLLGDKTQSDNRAILLGNLPVTNGHAHLLYPGDAQHTNLLLITSRFLVTEEEASIPPISPSPDLATWRYYGEFSQTPINSLDNTQRFSYLDHLRHLLASDPTLDGLGLPGGLNNWLYRNTSKILEWTESTREPWEDTRDIGFARRQSIRTLTYLDGLSFVQQDLPPGTPLLVNERLARLGLIPVDGPNQAPPPYLAHIVHHLNGLLQSTTPTTQTRKNIAAIISAMNNVEYWLSQVRHDAAQIMKMSDQQLKQPATLSLLNDMIDNANHAYVGQADPSTGEMRQGVIWIHEHLQDLATLDITTFSATSSPLQMIPDTRHSKAQTGALQSGERV